MAEVVKITIKIGEVEVNLTPEEAKSLRDVLIHLLGGKEVVREVIYKNPPWVWPYWSISDGESGDRTPVVTYSSTSDSSSSNLDPAV